MKKITLIALFVVFGFTGSLEECSVCIRTKPMNECIGSPECSVSKAEKSPADSVCPADFKFICSTECEVEGKTRCCCLPNKILKK